MEVYHDIWVKGEVHATGQRPGESRWLALQPLFAAFQRPFTMLDLGCGLGYFCFRAAAEHNCVAVGIDARDDCLAFFKANSLPRSIFLHRNLSLADLHALADCERFDVVLALNFLHHYETDPAVTLAALDEVLRMGDMVVIETPPPDDMGACGQGVTRALYDAISSLGGMLIAQTPSHTAPVTRPMWLLNRHVVGVVRPFIGAEGPYHMVVQSNFHERTVTFPAKAITRDWIAGINLQTYLQLGGCYPAREKVAAMLRAMPLPTERHGDMKPWNFILSGDAVHLIDGHDANANFDDKEAMAETIAAVEGA